MAAKIKDGLFIGDAETSQDPEFLELNKINSLINFAGREVPNVWAAHGLVYNTYNWEDREDFKVFDPKNEILSEIVLFVDKSLRHGGSVLMFSLNGTGRCTVAACAYLMQKYGWGFEKSYDFVYSKKPDIELNRGFVEQLFILDKKLRAKRYQGKELTEYDHMRISGWDPAYLLHAQHNSQSPEHNKRLTAASAHLIPESSVSDELLMINSYINSKLTISSLPGPYHDAMKTHKNFTLQINLANNQEAGVHLQRRAPPPSNYRPPKGGILKGGASNGRAAAKRHTNKVDAKAAHRGSTGSRRSTMRDLEESDDDIADFASGAKREASPPLLPSEQASVVSDGRGRYDAYDSKLEPFPQGSVASTGSDLYDFVGLNNTSAASVRGSHEGLGSMVSSLDMTSAHGSTAESKTKERVDSGKTPEERLHSLLGSLQRGKTRTASSEVAPAAEEKGSSREYARGDLWAKATARQQQQQQHIDPSIHDVASMPVTPAYRAPAGRTREREAKEVRGSGRTAGMGMPVRAGGAVTSSSAGASGGWMQEDGNQQHASQYYNHSGGRVRSSRGPSSSGSSRHQPAGSGGAGTSRKPPQQYRHGSPAPQVSRTGLTSRAAGMRGGSNGDIHSATSSIAESASGDDMVAEAVRKQRQSVPGRTYNSSGSGRSSTPPRQRSGSAQVSSSLLQSTASSSRRAMTPNRDKRSSTPVRERRETPTRDRRSTPQREPRGWRY